MNKQMTAAERLSRLLAVIPYVVERRGAPIDEIATRFDYPREQLVADLTGVLFFVGVHPFTPDSLIEVDITDDEVQISYADWFSRPLRLTSSEAARLLTAASSVLSEGYGLTKATNPLVRALTKLRLTLGDAAEEAVAVQLGSTPQNTLAPLQSALVHKQQLEIDYYTFGRHRLSKRTVEPLNLFSDNGNWYLQAWCTLAEGERIFRVDRIHSLRVTNNAVTRQASSTARAALTTKGNEPKVVLRLQRDCEWVAQHYQTESTSRADDGALIVELVVLSEGWLEHLLLQLGGRAEVLHIDEPLSASLVSQAAKRVLTRYC